jgi:hypothetical protein
VKAFAVGFALVALSSGGAFAQGADVNEANNPLTPKITINFQDYYVPSIHGLSDRDSNQFLFRGLIPWKLGDSGQLFRFTVPLATSPTFPDGTTTGLGDVTLMNLTPFSGSGHITFAAGPIVVLPTGSRAHGSGAWQLGAAGVVIAPQPWGLLGGLATYQHSLDDTYSRVPVSLLTFQPVVNINLPHKFYIRSSAIWTFNLEGDGSYIPIGLGLGRVFDLGGGTTMNAFIEPQYTVWHDGPGAPRWQIFAGVNFQLTMGK